MGKYIIGIDQSTQGTKAVLVGENGNILRRVDYLHRQIVNEKGWISHDVKEIYQNVIKAVKKLIEDAFVEKDEIAGVAISNQRETTVLWDRVTGEPLDYAIVWQCTRAMEICKTIKKQGKDDFIRQRTGLELSPYFPAAKIAWLFAKCEKTDRLVHEGNLCAGTMDSWLIFKLTNKLSFKTDYSNASRTQLFDLFQLKWNEEICSMFGIPISCLPEVCDSDANFGYTDFEGILEHPVPIHGVMGDSHGALFGQGCLKAGMTKATYGTGSSVMMNIGETPILSGQGLVTSLAWGRQNKINYVLEGNLNYTGAVITWLKDELCMIKEPGETEELAKQALKDDSLYLVPAFSGLGAPYWVSGAKAAFVGMSRTTGKKEIVRAALESIAYQITDVIMAMEKDTTMKLEKLCVDGGPTKNGYLMQFQSDLTGAKVLVPDSEELSVLGVVYAAGMAMGIWDEKIFSKIQRTKYEPYMDENVRNNKYSDWKMAVEKVIY